MPLIPARGTTPRHSSLHRARIIDTPATTADPVRVVIPEFGTQFWGPMGWTPRVDSAGRMVLPAAGVPCIVALDGRRQPLGVMAWGDGTEAAPAPPTPPPTIEAPIVTSLPGSPTAGQAIRYRHTAGQPPWLCIWDPDLNGGAGAWAVVGGPALTTTQSAFSDLTGAGNLGNLTALTIPVGGVWRVHSEGLIQLRTTAGSIIAAACHLRRNTSNIARVSIIQANAQFQTEIASRDWQGTLSAADTLTLRAELITSGTWRFGGDDLPWTIAAWPLELRP